MVGNNDKKKGFDGLTARLEDLKKRAIRGSLGISAFFSPTELSVARDYLARSGVEFIAYGGYGDFERGRIYILPDFFESGATVEALAEYGYSCEIDALLISGSGFESFSHRDALGSLMGLGIERDALGDIIMLSDDSAIALCDAKISRYIEEGLCRVGRDSVTVKRCALSEIKAPNKSRLPISDTVASPRLDCVVAALCSLSRERAKEKILASTVELDYICEERPDREVNAPATLSVRGVGKFKIISVCEKTKKGRFRLLAEKYV